MISDGGKTVRFAEENVRSMGRTARGVRGIKLVDDQQVISLIIPEEGGTILALWVVRLAVFVVLSWLMISR